MGQQFLQQAAVEQQVAMREIEAQHAAAVHGAVVTPVQAVPLAAAAQPHAPPVPPIHPHVPVEARAVDAAPVTEDAVAKQPLLDTTKNVSSTSVGSAPTVLPEAAAAAALAEPQHVDLTYQQALESVSSRAFLKLGTPQWQHNRFQVPDNDDPLVRNVSMDETSRVIAFSAGQATACMSLFTWYPIPSDRSATFYYEVHIQDKPADSACAVGIAVCPYPSSHMVGQVGTSIAYHSDDGRIMWSDEQVLKLVGETNADARGDAEYGPPFGQGDVIGVGYRPADGLVFFTRNGRELGQAKTGFAMGRQLFGCLSMQGRGKAKAEFRAVDFCV